MPNNIKRKRETQTFWINFNTVHETSSFLCSLARGHHLHTLRSRAVTAGISSCYSSSDISSCWSTAETSSPLLTSCCSTEETSSPWLNSWYPETKVQQLIWTAVTHQLILASWHQQLLPTSWYQQLLLTSWYPETKVQQLILTACKASCAPCRYGVICRLQRLWRTMNESDFLNKSPLADGSTPSGKNLIFT